jgi:hypothetical protein
VKGGRGRCVVGRRSLADGAAGAAYFFGRRCANAFFAAALCSLPTRIICAYSELVSRSEGKDVSGFVGREGGRAELLSDDIAEPFDCTTVPRGKFARLAVRHPLDREPVSVPGWAGLRRGVPNRPVVRRRPANAGAPTDAP